MRYFIVKRHISDQVLNNHKELDARSEEDARREFNLFMEPLISQFTLRLRYGQELILGNIKRDHYIQRVILGEQEYCLTSDYILSSFQYGN